MPDMEVKKDNSVIHVPPDVIIIMCISCCSFMGYNVAQPLFPAICRELGLSSATVSLMTTCVMFLLGAGPVFYGVLLGKCPLLRTLAIALVFYAAALLAPPLGGSFPVILCARCVQGLALPAIMVCCMTYISTRYSGMAVQKYLSFNAFSVITGSFSGRLLGGFVETVTGEWRMAFAANFIIILCVLPFCRLLRPAASRGQSFDPRGIARFLRQKNIIKLLFLPAAMVIASTSSMQVLPFRLRDIDPEITTFQISLVYTGIIICATTGLFAPRIIACLKSEMYAIAGAVCLFLAFFPTLACHSLVLVGGGMVLANFGYSFLYVSMPGIINRYSRAERSITNGTYLTAYYLSGSTGSYFPLLIYEHASFDIYLGSMWVLSLITLFMALNLRNLKIR